MTIIVRPLRVLVLDDEEYRVDGFRSFMPTAELTHAKSAPEAKHLLKNLHYDAVFLDHDLELSTAYYSVLAPGSGTDVVEWLVRLGRLRWQDTLFVIHSVNYERGCWMTQRLHDAGFLVTRRAYAWMDRTDLRNLEAFWTWPMTLERVSTAWPITEPEHLRCVLPRRAQWCGRHLLPSIDVLRS